MSKRHDGRNPAQLRPISIRRHFTRHAGGSVLISFGDTRVLCTAMLEKDLPPWLRAKGPGAGGWLTAEYGMLPSSTTTRKRRDSGKPDGRSVEIQRLIGRALRSCIDLAQLDGLTLFVDCDVLQADGGTRTAAITGAWVAVMDAVTAAKKAAVLAKTAEPIRNQVAAVSVGIVEGTPVLDLDYAEDVEAHVDMNVAMLADNTYVEVQGTGEHATFSAAELEKMLKLASAGIAELHAAQRKALHLKKAFPRAASAR
ncbi:MAG TPA: ribonuclease PH [Phycisphaerae bacterium]|nr:ribonuclease PH [Phycisphaerae bacterium]